MSFAVRKSRPSVSWPLAACYVRGAGNTHRRCVCNIDAGRVGDANARSIFDIHRRRVHNVHRLRVAAGVRARCPGGCASLREDHHSDHGRHCCRKSEPLAESTISGRGHLLTCLRVHFVPLLFLILAFVPPPFKAKKKEQFCGRDKQFAMERARMCVFQLGAGENGSDSEKARPARRTGLAEIARITLLIRHEVALQ